jgi:hypothetical protein
MTQQEELIDRWAHNLVNFIDEDDMDAAGLLDLFQSELPKLLAEETAHWLIRLPDWLYRIHLRLRQPQVQTRRR